ncbi:hypothetical protein ACQPYH_07835 [Kribbella sp. CA-245084]|uniref:hypothetical protein n=1 Tax=Kribbella sp. CA-245084 TaxID=3239940 RepID=UPI003D93C098
MERNESEIRVQQEMRLAHFRAYAALPGKMPELIELYRAAADDESEDQTVTRISELFGSSRDVAFAIHNCQLLYLHPAKQAHIRQEIRELERYLGQDA